MIIARFGCVCVCACSERISEVQRPDKTNRTKYHSNRFSYTHFRFLCSVRAQLSSSLARIDWVAFAYLVLTGFGFGVCVYAFDLHEPFYCRKINVSLIRWQ